MKSRSFALALLVSAALVLAGCGQSGGYQRGIFTGYVVDTPEDEIISKIGKPDRIDAAESNSPKWVYNKKTFDPDNMNTPDNETILVFKRDAGGKLKVAEVTFN